jgi:type IV pilus assembly protein PilY1
MIRNKPIRNWIAVCLLQLMLFSQIVEAATVTLATAPLANSTTTAVRPNIMYILDNSGSMDWEYLPDYVNDSMCWSGTSDSNSRTSCPSSYSSLGSTGGSVTLPFAAYDFNRVYYSPNIRYKPPVKADGTSYANATSTSAWTNGFAGTGSVNLTTGYPHQVWCTASGTATPSPSYNSATGVVTLSGGTAPNTWECKENNDTSVSPYLYPISVYTTAKSYNGAPYYYNMAPLRYCLAGSTPSDANCQYGADATHTDAYKYLWCGSFSSTTDTFSSCADLYDPRAASTHTIPDFLGAMVPASGTTTRATVTITVTGNITSGFSINGLYVNGTNIISGSVAGAGTTTATATAIKNAIKVANRCVEHDLAGRISRKLEQRAK